MPMAVTLEQFVKQLEDSGILAGDTLKDFVPPKAAPKDAEDLARNLVRQKKLTKFQAEEISRGKGKSLTLGNYVVLEKIGQGGMGAVYKAEHRRMKRTVAIKMLPPALMKNAEAAARFQREVEAAAKLRHTNIVAADDADEANGIHFLVMECVDGSDLSALVKKNGPLPVARAVNYILQAARGLEFAHKKGIVHRDVTAKGLVALQNCKSLGTIELDNAVFDSGKYTLADVQKLQDALPQCRVVFQGVKSIPGLKPGSTAPAVSPASTARPWESPAFQQWMKEVAALPAENQVEAVSKKLIEMNPLFDGKIEKRSIESNAVTRIDFRSDHVTDVSPLRALTGLKILICPGSGPGRGKLSDLSPLEGMQLTELICYWTAVADLSPIQKFPLTKLDLAGAPVSDLSPLEGMPLKWLAVSETRVSDASPLRKLPLTFLRCDGTQLSDLSPLKELPLKSLACDFKADRDSEILRSIKTLETINRKPAAEFWKEVEGQEKEQKP
jgi:hypothetical protein